jgi:SAM-dependent methyltransferase
VAGALQNTVRIARAVGTNQVARLFPSVYVQLTGQTGRGDRSGETPEAVADYFLRSFHEYFATLDVPRSAIGDYLAGKLLVEYGPGDLPGVAILMLAHGARRVVCVDRFPLVNLSSFATATLQVLLSGLAPAAAERARAALRYPKDLTQGFRPERLDYLVTRDGLCGLQGEADVVFSRAVLEHVNDLPATFADMAAALKPGGVAVHLVDLKSHGLHQTTPLDFLTWPTWLWDLMYSAKGVPNRLRVDSYRRQAEQAGLRLRLLRSTGDYSKAEIEAVRSDLAPEFRSLSDDDLGCKGFWLVCDNAG